MQTIWPTDCSSCTSTDRFSHRIAFHSTHRSMFVWPTTQLNNSMCWFFFRCIGFSSNLYELKKINLTVDLVEIDYMQKIRVLHWVDRQKYPWIWSSNGIANRTQELNISIHWKFFFFRFNCFVRNWQQLWILTSKAESLVSSILTSNYMCIRIGSPRKATIIISLIRLYL